MYLAYFILYILNYNNYKMIPLVAQVSRASVGPIMDQYILSCHPDMRRECPPGGFLVATMRFIYFNA